MSASPYATTPPDTDHVPGGIPYIIGNEVAERFSFYGMYLILADYLTKYLKDCDGNLAVMSETESNYWIHAFVSAAYFFPLLGALLSDAVLGKYRTILYVSLLYCVGHGILSFGCGRVGLFYGMLFIALGAGGIKPCVSAHVGDQFGPRNQHLTGRVFGWFYFAINLGAFAASVLSPIFLEKYGPDVAFGIPGVLMLIATVVFWLGRYRYAHIPPGGRAFVQEAFSPTTASVLIRLLPIYVLVTIFWALHDQTGSSWIHQGNRMNGELFRYTGSDGEPVIVAMKAAQLSAANPLLVMTLIPLYNLVIFPWIAGPKGRVGDMTKLFAGFVMMGVAFAMAAGIEMQLPPGPSTTGHAAEAAPATQAPQVTTNSAASLHLAWQLIPYLVLTAAEVLVYATCLEMSYTQAPNKLKSLVMAIFLLTISVGNALTSAINLLITKADGTSALPGASYFWFFTGLMVAATLLLWPIMSGYKSQVFVQGQEAPLPETAPESI